MNDFTWSSSACGIPDRLRSTSYARLQQCRNAHPLVVPTSSDEDAARFIAQWEANLNHAHACGQYPYGPSPERPTYSGRGTRWTEAAKWEMFIVGCLGFFCGWAATTMIH